MESGFIFFVLGLLTETSRVQTPRKKLCFTATTAVLLWMKNEPFQVACSGLGADRFIGIKPFGPEPSDDPCLSITDSGRVTFWGFWRSSQAYHRRLGRSKTFLEHKFSLCRRRKTTKSLNNKTSKTKGEGAQKEAKNFNETIQTYTRIYI